VGHLGPQGRCRRTGRDPKASARGLNRLCLDLFGHKELCERSTQRLGELRPIDLQDSPSPSLVDLLKSFYAKARTLAAEKDPSPIGRDLLKSFYAKARTPAAEKDPSPKGRDLLKSFYAKARTPAAEKDPSPIGRDLLKSPYAKVPAQDATEM
jgi:hypothetical protein